MELFDEPALKRRLEALPDLARVAFAAACAARMIEPWRDARRTLGMADSDQLPEAVASLWRYIRGGPVCDWASLAEALISEIPDEDEISTPSHAVLDDALAATAYALRAALKFEPKEAAWAGRRLYEATDTHVQWSMTFREYRPEIECALADHPCVQQELLRQARDLDELETAGPPVSDRNESAFD